MRVLLAVHQFPPEFAAGTETLTLRVAQELARRGYTVTVLAAGPSRRDLPPLSEHHVEGVRVLRLNPPAAPPFWRGGIVSSYWRPDLAVLLETVLDMERPDLVHVFHLRRLTLELLYLCRRRRLSVVATLTDYWCCCPTGQLSLPDLQLCAGPEPGSANCARHLAARLVPPLQATPLAPWRWLMRIGGWAGLRRRPQEMDQTFAACQVVLVGSETMAATLRRNGFAHWPVQVCPHGVVATDQPTAPLRPTWQPGTRPARVGFIGTLRPAKGAHLLLEALQSWTGPALELSLYGSPLDDPGYAARLRRHAGRLPPRVTPVWMGTFPPAELDSVLGGLDVLVVPSLWIENSPLIVLQALAARLPVVAFDVEGIREQIDHDRTGVLVPLGDAPALAEALLGLLQQPGRLEALAGAPRTLRSIQAYVTDLGAHYRRAAGALG